MPSDRSLLSSSVIPAKIRRREERRQVILEVATQLFGERGYHGTSMRDLGDALGIYPGSLYAHIRSKEDVLYEIVEHVSRRYEQELGHVLASGLRPVDQLRDLARRHLAVVAGDLQAATVHAHEWQYLGPPQRALAVAARDRYEAGVRSIVTACVDDGTFRPVDVPLASVAILSLLNWTCTWYVPSGRLTAAEVADHLVDVAILGLARRPDGPGQ